MTWLEIFLFFLIVRGLVYLIAKLFKKEPPLDLEKNSEYYTKEFPELLKEKEVETPPVVEQHIHFHITHNHLHINSNEGK